jgi:antitoxin component YwqK of YwqJK toxin-antitoxin module
MRYLSIFLFTICLIFTGCRSSSPDKSDTIVSIQVIDRNGFTETISSTERLKPYQAADFLTPQPFQKVLRVYGRSLEGKTLSKITSYHPNGQIWQYLEVTDGRAHGAYQEWYANGQKRIDIHVIEGVADINDLAQSSWVFEGKALIWNEEGSLIAEFTYDKGVMNAPATYYHDNGKVKKIVPYENGLKEGTVFSYDTEGSLVKQTEYLHGQKHGSSTALWSPDILQSSESYDSDHLHTATYYSPLGDLLASISNGHGKRASFEGSTLASLTEYVDGLPCGTVERFRANGALERSYGVKGGKKNGEEIEYYFLHSNKELKPKLSIQWHDDQIQGQVKTWYENGVLESQREMNQNKKQGMSVAWYKNGDLMLVEDYQNDLLLKGTYYKKGDKKAVSYVEEGNGTASLYTQDGIFLKKIPYEKGKPQLQTD